MHQNLLVGAEVEVPALGYGSAKMSASERVVAFLGKKAERSCPPPNARKARLPLSTTGLHRSVEEDVLLGRRNPTILFL